MLDYIAMEAITAEVEASSLGTGGVAMRFDTLDVPSPSLYILGSVTRSPSRFTERVS